MSTFREDLDRAVAYHGHLCSGQIIGVRMARLGLSLLGIEDAAHYRDLIVYIESDRCIADAIGTISCCKMGRRRLKWMDYGKTAATFLDLQSGKAFRIYRKYRVYPPEGTDLVDFFEGVSDKELFTVEEVSVHLMPGDLPGPPSDVQVCCFCGEEILDGRQVLREGKICCKACADGAYYKVKGPHPL